MALHSSLFALLLLTGCASTRNMPLVTTETSHDTVYLNKVVYDSTYIHHDHLLDRSCDTVLVRDKTVEYRYRILRDTIRMVRCDTIPIVHEVEVVREVRHVPAIYRYALIFSITIILSIILFISWKIRH